MTATCCRTGESHCCPSDLLPTSGEFLVNCSAGRVYFLARLLKGCVVQPGRVLPLKLIREIDLREFESGGLFFRWSEHEVVPCSAFLYRGR